MMNTRLKKHTQVKGLVHESKVGLALLMSLTLGESIEKLVSDGEVRTAGHPSLGVTLALPGCALPRCPGERPASKQRADALAIFPCLAGAHRLRARREVPRHVPWHD